MSSTVVESTTLARVAYDDLRQLLRLEFRSRAIYQYSDVPTAVHQALLQATSKGSYFNRVIVGSFPMPASPMPRQVYGLRHAGLRADDRRLPWRAPLQNFPRVPGSPTTLAWA